ncbi:MAG TPA: hypothetical protein VF719_10760, partial [Abditibacteriaceae bacterium]
MIQYCYSHFASKGLIFIAKHHPFSGRAAFLAITAASLTLPVGAQNPWAANTATNTLASTDAPQPPSRTRTSITKTTYLDRDAYRMSDGKTEAIIVPALGRVMSYRFVGGSNLLWNNPNKGGAPGGWMNYGGDKTWVGPQSAWPVFHGKAWPPDKVFDGTAHQDEVIGNDYLIVTSPVSPNIGSRIVRSYSFEHGEFVIGQTVEKLRGTPVQMSIWSITQVNHPDAVFFLANPKSTYRDGFHWMIKPKTASPVELKIISQLPMYNLLPTHLLRAVPSPTENFKFGLDSPESALASVKDGVAFVQRSAKPKGQYPDGAEGSGFPVEFYSSGMRSAPYVELEILSPIRLFHAGTSWTHTVRWNL